MTSRRATAFLVGALALGLPLTGCGSVSQADGDELASPMRVNEADSAAAGDEGLQVTLDRASGSGCPAGAATDGGLQEGNEFVVDFTKFVAEGGSGVEARRRMLSCTVDLAVHLPDGWRASLEEIGYEGAASGVHSEGATALIGAKWWVAGAKETLGQENLTADAEALRGDSWSVRAEPSAAWLDGTCARADTQLRVTTTLRADVTQDAHATITLDRARLRLHAERC